MQRERVEEGAAANLAASFFDDNDDPLIPNAGTIFYSVRDNDGATVGGLLDVAITPEAAVVYFSVDGINNLIDGALNARCVRVVAKYNSVTWGNDRDITIEFTYLIDNHNGVSA